MEKLKDFVHDFSDIFFAVIIIGIMFVVLSLNLGSWFNDSSDSIFASNNVSNVFKAQDNSKNNNIKDDNKQVETEDKEYEDMNETEIKKQPDTNASETEIQNKQGTDTDSNTIQDGQDNNEENEHNKPVTEVIEAEVVVETKTIIIPNGASSTRIAQILKDNGLIDNINTFDEACKNLNLASRLKPGTFQIPTNSTIEDMVQIIAKQKIM